MKKIILLAILSIAMIFAMSYVTSEVPNHAWYKIGASIFFLFTIGISIATLGIYTATYFTEKDDVKGIKDTKTTLQIKFEEQTPTIKYVGNREYLQTYISWLEFQIEKQIELNKNLANTPEICDYCMEMKDYVSVICSDCATENNM